MSCFEWIVYIEYAFGRTTEETKQGFLSSERPGISLKNGISVFQSLMAPGKKVFANLSVRGLNSQNIAM